MKLKEFIELCADEDILLKILDDESGEVVYPFIWKSDYEKTLCEYLNDKEVQSFYHTNERDNLVMEIYIKQ